MKKTLLLLLFTLTTLAGHADEGMWMLTDLKEQNAATMYDMGTGYQTLIKYIVRTASV